MLILYTVHCKSELPLFDARTVEEALAGFHALTKTHLAGQPARELTVVFYQECNAAKPHHALYTLVPAPHSDLGFSDAIRGNVAQCVLQTHQRLRQDLYRNPTTSGRFKSGIR